jgi:SAM-dependent methyltransferase
MGSDRWLRDEYTQYWQGQAVDLSLAGYCRNRRLPDLFRPGETVLDLGAGYGAVANYLSRERGCKVVGLDVSGFGCGIMRSKLGLAAVRADATASLPFRDESFDVVFWGDNAEHLLDPLATLLEIKRITRRGGRIVLTCPNTGSVTYRWRYLVYGIVWNVEASGNPPWRWQHIRFFNQTVLRKMVEAAGLRVSRFLGAHDNDVLDRFAQRWSGLLSPVIIAEIARDKA